MVGECVPRFVVDWGRACVSGWGKKDDDSDSDLIGTRVQ